VTYADKVQLPMLIIQGRNDAHCPARQMEDYVDKLQAVEKSVTIEWFDAGHGVLAQEQQLDHFSQMLQFIYRILD
jgi:dipeptidyl aminopeptidase/acylaminoacyl peptidase